MNLNHVSFTERMEEGKALALRDRNRGLAGNPFANVKRPVMEDTEENRLRVELKHLRGELRDRENTIDVLKAGGSVDYGNEFDAIFSAAKAEAAPVTRKAETAANGSMNTAQYLKALRALDLTPSGKATAEALGLSVRQCQRLAAGETEIPVTVAKLLRMYQAHGLPEA